VKARAPISFALWLLALTGCAVHDAAPPAATALQITETADTIVIQNGDAHVLTYHKSEVPAPAGSSPLYNRSGFLDPVTAPNGDVVTGIHPPGHLHHMGLWHAWVKATHKGREVDFWNLGTGTATVRYASTVGIRRSPDAVGFSVIQHHVILPDEVVLEETFSIDVHVHPDGHYLIDYVAAQNNVTDAPLLLPAYRYGGGIAYRGPSHWNAQNSEYLTSEGRGREDGHTTRARWCTMFGETEHGTAALTILGHPKNHDAPQRQRIWPAATEHGAIFFNFVPIQETGWALEPGQPCTMRYRLVVSAGTPDKDQVEGWFQTYIRQNPE
jgi:hypothetical protein